MAGLKLQLNEIIIHFSVEGSHYIFFPFSLFHQGKMWNIGYDVESYSRIHLSTVGPDPDNESGERSEATWSVLADLGKAHDTLHNEQKLGLFIVPFVLWLDKPPPQPFMTITHWFGLTPSLATIVLDCRARGKRIVSSGQHWMNAEVEHTHEGIDRALERLPLWGENDYPQE